MKNVSSSVATVTAPLGRLLDIEQLTRTLAFLAGYRPDGASHGVPRPPLDGRMAREDGPEPYCTACDQPAGIFLGYGADWRHFRVLGRGAGADAALARTEVYATDHAPAIGWRYTAPAATARSPQLAG